MGKQDDFTTLMPLNLIPKFFTFRDYNGIPPEDREQRKLNTNRVPEIARYILENEEGWLFSSITASYKVTGELMEFLPFSENDPDIGYLAVDPSIVNVINDGQHQASGYQRGAAQQWCAARRVDLCAAIPVRKAQPCATDVHGSEQECCETSKSLNILFDHRDPSPRRCGPPEQVEVSKDS
jgi:DNA sulfur modification protein DndB